MTFPSPSKWTLLFMISWTIWQEKEICIYVNFASVIFDVEGLWLEG